MYQYIRYNSFIRTNSVNSVSIYHREQVFLTRSFSIYQHVRDNSFIQHTVGYNVSLYQKKWFYLYTLGRIFSEFQAQHFFLTHCWLHSVSVSHTILLSSPTVGYILSVYHTQYFCPHPLLVTFCQCITHNIFVLTHCWLHCVSLLETKILYSQTFTFTVSVCRRLKIYLHPLLFNCVIIRVETL